MKNRTIFPSYLFNHNLIILVLLNCFTLPAVKSQNNQLLSLAWKNTFGGAYLNSWILINKAEYSDSVAVIEGGMGAYQYTEVEDQCKYLATKDQIVVIDDVEKVIYKMHNSFDKKTHSNIEFSSMEFDTTTLAVDSTTESGKYIYATKYFESDIKIQIDMKSMLIDWIQSVEPPEPIDGEPYEMLTEVTQTFTLVSHATDTETVSKYLKVDNYIKKTGDEYKGEGNYKNYDVLNLVD